jgi:hypothetical protein
VDVEHQTLPHGRLQGPVVGVDSFILVFVQAWVMDSQQQVGTAPIHPYTHTLILHTHHAQVATARTLFKEYDQDHRWA